MSPKPESFDLALAFRNSSLECNAHPFRDGLFVGRLAVTVLVPARAYALNLGPAQVSLH